MAGNGPCLLHKPAAALEMLEGAAMWDKVLTQAGASVERERKEYGKQR
jgi:hypothetical protein